MKIQKSQKRENAHGKKDSSLFSFILIVGGFRIFDPYGHEEKKRTLLDNLICGLSSSVEKKLNRTTFFLANTKKNAGHISSSDRTSQQ